ncbi:MAG: ATP-dependent helicase HrpB [Sphingomonadales bacterium]
MRLPIDDILPDLRAALRSAPNAVLVAPPGSGKTTRVPLALIDEPWLEGRRIVMLEPRRLAARMAARFMAQSLGEKAGGQVGYRVRLESAVSAATRVEVVTEGVLLRQLQADPGLDGVGAVIFDEFHERSLDGDLSLALCRDIQAGLRPDLRLVLMSATLDDDRIAALLDDAAVLRGQGQVYPVTRRHVARRAERPLAQEIAALIRQALREEPVGDVLAFATGEAEIRRICTALTDAGLPPGVTLHPLYGALSPAAQDAAIAAAPAGQRKVVVATTIAETSVTIEGIRLVVDGGYKRAPRFDPGSGMTRLETVRVSRAAADQRCGRAGRLGPGLCYRLWAAEEERGLAAFDKPEILDADLAELALQLALWGTPDPAALRWVDPPPAAALAQARALLMALGALDPAGHVTADGRAMARLPMHPRLAHMVVRADARDQATAAALAALLSERDPLGARHDADIRHRLEALAAGDRRLAPIAQAARQIRRLIGAAEAPVAAQRAGPLLALAYPDRLAKARGGDGRFVLAGGGGASVAAEDPLAAAPYLVAANLGGGGQGDQRIFLAAPIDEADIERLFADRIVIEEHIAWDPRQDMVRALRRRRLDALVLAQQPWPNPPVEAVEAAMLEGVRALGLDALAWTPQARQLRARIGFLRQHDPAGGWPDISDQALLAQLPQWLGPDLSGVTKRAAVAAIDIAAALPRLLDWRQQQALEALAPPRVAVPSGRMAMVDYQPVGGPVLAVKLQEMFGATASPRVLADRVALTLHLLSPAGRPLATTQDLANFWRAVYPQVRAEMRGRYPRHPWPENPLDAQATHRAKPRGG